jgi:gluconate 2-dehydrogenase gamma chain
MSGQPRRRFLREMVAIAGAAPMASALAESAAPAPASAPAPALSPVPRGYLSFNAAEAAFMEAVLNVMCPADNYSANGVDCGLAFFIDRQLAGGFGQGAGHYMSGPWAPGMPQAGLQLPMTPEQFFKAGLAAVDAQAQQRYGKPVDQMAPADIDAFLVLLHAGQVQDPHLPLQDWFRTLVYPLFEQACFADPIYGGNQDKVFWKMIGYPGLPATHTLNMVTFRGKRFPGASDPKSIADFS